MQEEKKEQGLIQKYQVLKADGRTQSKEADYFVLRLDEDDEHGAACRLAAVTYAQAIQNVMPQLAKELRERVMEHFSRIEKKKQSIPNEYEGDGDIEAAYLHGYDDARKIFKDIHKKELASAVEAAHYNAWERGREEGFEMATEKEDDE